MHYMKWPLSLLVAGWILHLIFMLIWGFAKPNVCSMSIFSSARICDIETEPGIEFKHAFGMQSKLVDVQTIAARSAELPFAIKKGQLATRDIDIAIANSDILGRCM